MPLILEIISALALLALLIYLKREQAKALVKRMTASEVFPKVFWGIILGIGLPFSGSFTGIGDIFDTYKVLSNINFLNTILHIRGTHFVGPIFGIFAGIIIGASSRPFSIKKSLYCLCAGFVGGLTYTIYLFLSEEPRYIPSTDMFSVAIYTLALMPIAIGIVDKSLFKAIIGIVGGGIAIFLFGIIWYCMTFESMLWGRIHAPIWQYISYFIGGILIIMGIEIAEVTDILLGDDKEGS